MSAFNDCDHSALQPRELLVDPTNGPAVYLAATDEREAPAPEGHDGGLVLEDLLVEDVSIDGMCGVY
jgi:mycofactocin precursor